MTLFSSYFQLNGYLPAQEEWFLENILVSRWEFSSTQCSMQEVNDKLDGVKI